MLGYSYHLLLVILIGYLVQESTGVTTSCDGQIDQSSFQSTEKELIGCLTSDLKSTVRPVRYPNETVQVTFSLATIAIADVDEKHHMLKMKGWLFQLWNDPQLTWDKNSYDGVDEIRLPANEIWTPDLVLYNSEDPLSLYDYSHSTATIRSDGTVFYLPINVNIKASCSLDFRLTWSTKWVQTQDHFPYDTQECVLVFGSWTNNVKRVNISVRPDYMKEVWHEGSEWKVKEHKIERMDVDFGEEYGGKYAIAIYTIKLKRNPVYYIYLYVLPAILLSFVIVFMYLIPPESGERLTLGGAVLIVLTLLLLMVENHLPTEVDSPPLLLKFLLYDLFMVIITLLLTVMSLNFHHRDIRKGKVPSWMRKVFFGKLSYYLCMQGAVYSSLPTNDQSGMDGTFDEVVTTSGSSPRDLRVDQELQDTSPLPKSPTLAIEKTMDEIRRYLRICAAKATLPEPVQSHRETVLNEWHLLTLIIDRMLFYLFFILNIIMAIGMFSH